MVKSMQEQSDTPYLGNLNVRDHFECQESASHRVQLDLTSVNIFDNPRCLRMSLDAEDGVEEATVRIPGILCSKTLPPVERPM